jgi:alpha-glucuronidase
VVVCTAGASCGDAISRSQLSAAAAELQTGLRGLLGTVFTATVTTKAQPPAAGTRLAASVLGGAASTALGTEGFRIRQDASSKTVHIEAASSSGLLYGTFKLLSLVQQHKVIPQDYESAPAMELRVWDLWDNVDGSIEQVRGLHITLLTWCAVWCIKRVSGTCGTTPTARSSRASRGGRFSTLSAPARGRPSALSVPQRFPM